MDGPAASVVIASHGRPLRLRWLLNALEEQTLPRAEWELIVVQYAGGGEEFSISANGVPGNSIRFDSDFAAKPPGDYVLELGGFSPEKESLFYGEVADLIIFHRALTGEETSAVTRSLIATHRM